MESIDILNKSILRRYVLGLSLIALLSLSAFFSVHHLMSMQEDSAEVVNLSGRQRMLSQRIALFSELYAQASETKLKDEYREQLLKNLALFQDSHARLSGKGEVRKGLTANTAEINELYFSAPSYTDQSVQEYVRNVELLMRSAEPAQSALQNIRILSQTTLIEKLDAIVRLHQKEDVEDVLAIKYTETAILVLTLVLLAFEALFIFRPMLKSTISLFRSLTEAREVAVRATDEKSTFLATITHEIRTPLIGVQSIAGFLLDSRLDETQHSQIKTVHRMTDTLIALINDILDFSKIESGKMAIEETDFNLKTMLSDTEALFQATARKKEIALNFHIDPVLNLDRRGDPMRMSQVLTNLISNALKFTPAAGLILVKVSETSQDEVCFEVQDNGIGLTEEQRVKLFARFVQADDSTSRKFGGTGLGLAISKQIVELMHGRIGVESKVGEGSTFWFKIPLGQALPSNISALPGSEVQVSWEGYRVLVAEDNLVMQKVAQLLLKSFGIDVVLANNGREAVEYCKTQSFDLVFLDCEMPELDGFEAAREIRLFDASPRVPILAMSAHIADAIRQKCLAAGMDGFVSKPMKRQSLAATLDTWMVRREDTKLKTPA